jgi:hypothetical protein
MEVETDDDLTESTNLTDIRSKGPPPDVTQHNFSKYNNSKRYHNQNNMKNSNTSNSNNKRNSTSENQPLLINQTDSNNNLSDDAMETVSDFVHLSCNNNFENDPEFNEKIKQVEFAIDHNVLPQRIYEGSSGSYFCKNSEFVTLIKI